MDEFDRQRLTDRALVVWGAEELLQHRGLVDRRQCQEGLTIYHMAMRMGYLDKKATEALTPLLGLLKTDDDLGEYLKGRIRRHVEACVKPLRDLEKGHKEWTVRDLISYAHALGQRAKIEFVPEVDEDSIEARHQKLNTRVRRLFQ